jgi:NAD+ kinase
MNIISDKNKKSLKLKSLILKKLKNNDLKNKKITIVVGGDGFMLQTLKKNTITKKLFYGINSGDYGFLMNKLNLKYIHKDLTKSKLITISPLSMKVTSKNNKVKKTLAINEVSILRQSRQAAKIEVKTNKKILIKKLISDGVLVTTPAGSTAYNLSVHGPILNLNSKKIAVTPISPFRPRRWKSKILGNKTKVTIKNLDISKRPISAVADNIEFRNAKKVEIEMNKKINFNLLYNANSNLEKKIKIEQIRKEKK